MIFMPSFLEELSQEFKRSPLQAANCNNNSLLIANLIFYDKLMSLVKQYLCFFEISKLC